MPGIDYKIMLDSRFVGGAVLGSFVCIGAYIGAYILSSGVQEAAIITNDGLVNAMSGQGSGAYHMEHGLKAIGDSQENGVKALARAIEKVGSIVSLHR